MWKTFVETSGLFKIGCIMQNTMKYLTFFLIAALFVIAGRSSLPAQTVTPSDGGIFPEGSVILFQGDSITDGNRGRSEDPNHIHGHGYVYLIASYLGANFPEKNWTFVNRGVSGDTVEKLAARWQNDAIGIKPDVISILVGANVWILDTTPEEFESSYDRLLAATLEALPNVKFVLIEPFCCQNGGAQMTKEYREAVVRLAEKYHAPFVSLQNEFDRLTAESSDPHRWVWDGIHPTTAGHWVIFTRWLDAVRSADF